MFVSCLYEHASLVVFSLPFSCVSFLIVVLSFCVGMWDGSLFRFDSLSTRTKTNGSHPNGSLAKRQRKPIEAEQEKQPGHTTHTIPTGRNNKRAPEYIYLNRYPQRLLLTSVLLQFDPHSTLHLCSLVCCHLSRHRLTNQPHTHTLTQLCLPPLLVPPPPLLPMPTSVWSVTRS